MKISRDSWHFKFVAWSDSTIQYATNPDLCAYVRAFLGATLMIVLVLGLCALPTYCLADAIGWVVAMLKCRAWLEPWVGATGFLGILFVAAFIAAFVFYFKSDTAEVVRLAVRARKERFCPLVEFD